VTPPAREEGADGRTASSARVWAARAADDYTERVMREARADAAPPPGPPAGKDAGDAAASGYAAVTAALRAAYDRGAGARERAEPAPWKLAERERFRDALRAAGARTLLEVGAGTGKDARYFRDQGLDPTCTDLSPAMVALCRAKGLRAEVRDALRLGLPPESFDAAYTFNCLLHLPKRDLPAALGAIRATLRPGGLLFLGVYGGRDEEGVWADDRHEPKRFFSFHTDAGLRAAVTPHFEVLEQRTVPVDERGTADLHFQALLLRRPPSGAARSGAPGGAREGA
jgi:SAM-dependent methyltransferase